MNVLTKSSHFGFAISIFTATVPVEYVSRLIWSTSKRKLKILNTDTHAHTQSPSAAITLYLAPASIIIRWKSQVTAISWIPNMIPFHNLQLNCDSIRAAHCLSFHISKMLAHHSSTKSGIIHLSTKKHDAPFLYRNRMIFDSKTWDKSTPALSSPFAWAYTYLEKFTWSKSSLFQCVLTNK